MCVVVQNMLANLGMAILFMKKKLSMVREICDNLKNLSLNYYILRQFALVNDDIKKAWFKHAIEHFVGGSWENTNNYCMPHISPKIHMHTWHQVGDKCLDNYVVFCVHAQQTFTFSTMSSSCLRLSAFNKFLTTIIIFNYTCISCEW